MQFFWCMRLWKGQCLCSSSLLMEFKCYFWCFPCVLSDAWLCLIVHSWTCIIVELFTFVLLFLYRCLFLHFVPILCESKCNIICVLFNCGETDMQLTITINCLFQMSIFWVSLQMKYIPTFQNWFSAEALIICYFHFLAWSSSDNLSTFFLLYFTL